MSHTRVASSKSTLSGIICCTRWLHTNTYVWMKTRIKISKVYTGCRHRGRVGLFQPSSKRLPRVPHLWSININIHIQQTPKSLFSPSPFYHYYHCQHILKSIHHHHRGTLNFLQRATSKGFLSKYERREEEKKTDCFLQHPYYPRQKSDESRILAKIVHASSIYPLALCKCTPVRSQIGSNFCTHCESLPPKGTLAAIWIWCHFGRQQQTF